jgi:hypothetical protein
MDGNAVVDVTDALMFLEVFPSALGHYSYSKRLDLAAPYGLLDTT